MRQYTLVLLLFLVACSNLTSRSEAPSIAQLQHQLQLDLERLGVDQSRTASSVATGGTNAVCDLSASVSTTSIELGWTERLIGDYDQNGEVNVADLSSIASYWEKAVEYDENGIPAGDPAGEGSLNWRVARVDGDANGLITIADITPLATHFREALDGYRVYRKGPGESGFIRLGELLTVARPTREVDKPVRYSLLDEPPVSGDYTYFVVPYSNGQGEAPSETRSNETTAYLSSGFADLSPPIWDDTAGITSAQANSDGTVTLTFGSASDLPIPPATNSLPVQYTVYFSTESPATTQDPVVFSGISSPWLSPQLQPSTTYYFVVRAKDSASPPNEEKNNNEFPVTTQAGSPVEDTDPPFWTELGRDWMVPYPQGESWPTEGFTDVRREDGKLVITRADAADVLSPPVHYDLYYMDPYDADFAQRELYVGNWPSSPNPIASVVEDIPKVYELTWPNRRPVLIGVRARDSAVPPNQDWNTKAFKTAPGLFSDVAVDSYVPGSIDNPSPFLYSKATLDVKRKRIYSAYMVRAEQPTLLRCATFDCATGLTNVEEVFRASSAPPSPYPRWLALSWKDELWLGFNWGDESHVFKKTLPDGVWQEWMPGRERFSWTVNFDHNGNPADFELPTASAVESGRFKLQYNYWDEASGEWNAELASDPGGMPEAGSVHHRPDGTLQIVFEYAQEWGGSLPTYSRIIERSPNGVWSVALEGYGYAMSYESKKHPDTWQSPWHWAFRSSMTGSDGVIAATFTGYSFTPSTFYKGNLVFGEQYWPAAQGYSALPFFVVRGDQQVTQYLWGADYNSGVAPATDYGLLTRITDDGTIFDATTGWFSCLVKVPNRESGIYQTVLRSPLEGETIFDWH